MFQAESALVAEDFPRADVYVENAVVVEWRVRRWNVVVQVAERDAGLRHGNDTLIWPHPGGL